MKQPTALQLTEIKKVRNRAFIPLGLFVLIHIFMVHYIFPLEGGFMRAYIPARTGGSYVDLSLDAFMNTSMIAIGASAIVGVLIFVLAYLKLHKLVLIIGFILFSLTAFRLSVQFSSALGSLWGDLGSVLGFLSMFALWFYLTWPILTTGIGSTPKKNNK